MTHLSTATNNHPNHTMTKGIAASLLAMSTLLPFTSVSAVNIIWHWVSAVPKPHKPT
jgi:hypothetical protein